MPRCKKERCCRQLDGERVFKPTAIPMHILETVVVELDEFEAVRLCDLEGKSQIEAGEIMDVSRGTVQRLLESGRRKIIDALLHEKALRIQSQLFKEESNQ